MVTVRRLKNRRTFPRALAPWWQDSNGFTELSIFGSYQTPAAEYVAQTRRHQREISNMAYASPQDWMCEPHVLAKTGLSIPEHQARTIRSLQTLRELAPEVPWVPVLQGWCGSDYMRHIEAYDRAGIDLRLEPLVGVGTVCRRQGTKEGLDLFKLLSWCGIRLHGFGVKISGLLKGRRYLTSADSLAWSYAARRESRPCPGGFKHKNCANCLVFALEWRKRIVGGVSSAIG